MNMNKLTGVGVMLAFAIQLNAQQLQYTVGSANNPPSQTQLTKQDSTQVYYSSATATVSDSVRQYLFDDATNQFVFNETKKFFYDAQSNCVKIEYYGSSNNYAGKDTIVYGTNGIDSIVRYDNSGNVWQVKKYFYTSSKLTMVYEIRYQPGSVDTSRDLLTYYSGSGLIENHITCGNMIDTSCKDTFMFFFTPDGKFDSLQHNNGSYYKATEYDPSYDLFSNNILTVKQTACYIDPLEMVTNYALVKDVKSITGKFYLSGNLVDISIAWTVVSGTATERTEKSTFDLVAPFGNYKQQDYYYFTGSQLPVPTSVVAPETFNVTTYFIDNQLFIESEELLSSVQLYTLGGKAILTQNIDNTNRTLLDLSELSAGMYYIQVVTQSGKVRFHPVWKQ